MSREKAIEFMEAIGSKDLAIESMVRNFAEMMPVIPASVWTEFFIDIDYSYIMNLIADKMSEHMTDFEIDELTSIAKTPLFQKWLKVYPSQMTTIQEHISSWLLTLRSNSELTRLGNLLRKAKVPEDAIQAVLESFVYAAGGFEQVQEPVVTSKISN